MTDEPKRRGRPPKAKPEIEAEAAPVEAVSLILRKRQDGIGVCRFERCERSKVKTCERVPHC